MARYLVTGGAGFIGSHLTTELLHRGHEVVVLDDLSGSVRERVPPGAEFVLGSVTDDTLVASLFTDWRLDGVYHIAAFAAEAISHAAKRYNYMINVIGSINLINASIRTGVEFFGFASSVAVYGHGRTPMRESDSPEPADSYGLSKLTVERELALTARSYGLAYTAFRMHNIYGEWQNMRDPYRNAVAIFLNQILRGEPITVYGDGQQLRAFTYVRDIVPVLAGAGELPSAWGKVFNVGASRTTTVLALAEQVRHAMGVPGHPISHLPARGEVAAAYTDTTRGRRVLGDWSEASLEDGLARTAAWARAQGSAELQVPFELELAGTHLPEWARQVQQRLAVPEKPAAHQPIDAETPADIRPNQAEAVT